MQKIERFHSRYTMLNAAVWKAKTFPQLNQFQDLPTALGRKKKKKKKQIGRLIYRVLTNTCASEATLRVFYNFGVCWLEKSPQIL